MLHPPRDRLSRVAASDHFSSLFRTTHDIKPSATSDGGPYAAGGPNEGCHGVARGAPDDQRCHGIGGSRGNAPHHDRAAAKVSRPTWRVRRLRSDHLSVHTSDGGPYAAGGRNGGCHGVARGAPADGRRHGIGGSRGNAPHPDRGRPRASRPTWRPPKASTAKSEHY